MRTAMMALSALVLAPMAWAGPVIGGFDLGRGGLGSWSDGGWAATTRAAVLSNFAGASFTGSSTLTAQYLGTLDVVLLTSATGSNSAISPLTQAEQMALSDFVVSGGRAIIVSDNSTFSGSAPAANASILDPFGAVAAGTLSGGQVASMVAGENPIASGRFGTADSITYNFPGWLSSWTVGTPFARLDANNEVAGLLIEADALAMGSGRVVIYTDSNSFGGPGFLSGSTNETAFLNALDWVVVPAPAGTSVLAVSVGLVTLRRRR